MLEILKFHTFSHPSAIFTGDDAERLSVNLLGDVGELTEEKKKIIKEREIEIITLKSFN